MNIRKVIARWLGVSTEKVDTHMFVHRKKVVSVDTLLSDLQYHRENLFITTFNVLKDQGITGYSVKKVICSLYAGGVIDYKEYEFLLANYTEDVGEYDHKAS